MGRSLVVRSGEDRRRGRGQRAHGRRRPWARDTTEAEPGTYEVILEPSATATLIDYLGYMGFGAKQVIEGESFFSSRTDEQVAAPSVTVADDVFHPESVGIGFDFEGAPKQRVAIIDSGIARGPVTDRKTARKLGSKSTGHNSGSGEFGPYAFNLVLEAGESSLDELIAEVEDGFLVTRFHYVNILDRPATELTGMTRDGTFRIRGGELAGAVHNFRFAQSACSGRSKRYRDRDATSLRSPPTTARSARPWRPLCGSASSTFAVRHQPLGRARGTRSGTSRSWPRRCSRPQGWLSWRSARSSSRSRLPA